MFAFKHTTLHEVAHGVFLRLLSAQTRSNWFALSGGSMILFNEQSRDPVEHFAHLYPAYVLNPIPMVRRFEPFYGFLKQEVFDGREYHGGN